jgi:hypothetical protein
MRSDAGIGITRDFANIFPAAVGEACPAAIINSFYHSHNLC